MKAQITFHLTVSRPLRWADAGGVHWRSQRPRRHHGHAEEDDGPDARVNHHRGGPRGLRAPRPAKTLIISNYNSNQPPSKRDRLDHWRSPGRRLMFLSERDTLWWTVIGRPASRCPVAALLPPLRSKNKLVFDKDVWTLWWFCFPAATFILQQDPPSQVIQECSNSASPWILSWLQFVSRCVHVSTPFITCWRLSVYLTVLLVSQIHLLYFFSDSIFRLNVI